MTDTLTLRTRFAADPLAFRDRLLKWLPKAPADEVAATRHELVDVADYMKRKGAGSLLEARRCARLTEWAMAHRWLANRDGVRRTDDRPPLHACNGDCSPECSADRRAWSSLYAVGRAERDRLLTEDDPDELTQASVIAWTTNGVVHVSNNSGENEWYTPADLIETARDAMGSIDIDPASSSVAQRTVRAGLFYTVDTDGLAHDWPGAVWLNPPYAQTLVSRFVTRLIEQLDAGITRQAVTLTNNATETLWSAALLRHADAVCFPTGRVRFLDSTGTAALTPLQGQMLTYHGGRVAEFVDRFNQRGPVVTR